MTNQYLQKAKENLNEILNYSPYNLLALKKLYKIYKLEASISDNTAQIIQVLRAVLKAQPAEIEKYQLSLVGYLHKNNCHKEALYLIKSLPQDYEIERVNKFKTKSIKFILANITESLHTMNTQNIHSIGLIRDIDPDCKFLTLQSNLKLAFRNILNSFKEYNTDQLQELLYFVQMAKAANIIEPLQIYIDKIYSQLIKIYQHNKKQNKTIVELLRVLHSTLEVCTHETQVNKIQGYINSLLRPKFQEVDLCITAHSQSCDNTMTTNDNTVTVLGTCRVHRPLQLATDQTINNGSTNYYVHNIQEICQQYEYMQNNLEIPNNLLLYITGKEYQTNIIQPQSLASNNKYIVEISSSKVYKYQDFYLQSNFLATHLLDKYNDSGLKHWWQTLHSQGVGNTSQLPHNLTELERDICTNLTFTINTPDILEHKLLEFIEQFEDRNVILVTHFNALDANNKTLPRRQELIANLIDIANKNNITLYNPTSLIQEYTQSKALKDNGLDLTHYSEEFEQVLSEKFAQVINQQYESKIPA